jgi:hypothetical protein
MARDKELRIPETFEPIAAFTLGYDIALAHSGERPQIV